MVNTIDGDVLGSGLRYDTQARISSDKLVFYVFLFVVLSILGQVSLILINWGQLPPVVPIFYSRPWGDLMLASPFYLWILPGVTFLFFTINYFLALYILRDYYFLNRVLVIFAALIAFATLYDMTRIIGLIV